MKRTLPLLLAALLCAGCVHSSSRDRRGFGGIRGEPEDNEFPLVVNVFADGRLELFGRRYDRDGLVDRLVEGQGGVTGENRMIVLKGQEGVSFGQLDSLKDFLVDRRLYRVSIETPRTASSRGSKFVPILPGEQLDVQILDPDDPIVRQAFGDE